MIDREIFELTNPQKSIWMMEQFYKGTNINNICGTLTIEEDVNLEKLNEAINIFVQNNKSFGLNFRLSNGELKQYFKEIEPLELECIKLKDESDIKKLAQEITEEVFDIEEDQLFRFKMFKLENNYGGFVVLTHHIISDAATMSIVAREIADIYQKLTTGEKIEPKDCSYEQYILAEQEYLKSSKFIKDKEYWNDIFKDIPEIASIPSIVEKSQTDLTGKSKREEFIFNRDLFERISQFCIQNKISNFNFFMAVYAIYLSRVSNLKDFVIGTPILNRTNFKEKHTTGMFINTAPLRIKIDNNIDFLSFAKNISQSSMSMLRYQKYSYQMLLEDLRKTNNSLPTLYDVMLSYQVTKATDSTSKLSYKTGWIPGNTISNGIYIHLHDNDDQGDLTVDYDYQVEKYGKQDIDNMHNRILHIIEQILENANCLEKDIEIVTKEEKNQILNVFNDTALDYKRNKTIKELFEEQVEKTPNNIAVVYNNEKITYRELNEKANCLANYLLAQGLKKEEPVPVLLERNINLIVSMIAIIKIGATYLPISTDFPIERIEYILKDSRANILITSRKNTKEELQINKVFIDELKFEQENCTNIKAQIKPEDNLYIIYTSGSTGNPKGVKINHRNLNNFVNTFTKNFETVNEKDRCLASTNIGFDVSIFEFFITLLNGAQLYLYDENSISDIFKYCNSIIKNQITLLYIPPNILEEVYMILSKEKYSYIDKILIGVEPIRNTTMQKYYNLNPNIKIVNAYGPTETTICATANILKKESLEKYSIIPIGRPIYNSKILILDDDLQLVPAGIKGELYISGDGVGNGYLNNKEKNDESFMKIPRLLGNCITYKTGDLAKWNEDGTISFIGRDDNQVKVSGHRIELGEIENCIYKYPKIEKTIVIIDENKKINAYYTSKENINVDELKKFMENKIPKYFIPNLFMQLEKFELTSNGKINKKLLPKIQSEYRDIKEPINKTQQQLKEIFEEILSMDNISVEDSFFDLGGDSLGAIKLTTILYDKLNVQININDIFDNPSIIKLAQLIKNSRRSENAEIHKAGKREFYPTSSAQKRIYYSSIAAGQDSILYNISGGIVLDKKPNIQKLTESFNKIIKDNESLRTCFEVIDGEIVQKIQEQVDFKIEFENEKNSSLEEISKKFIKPFDLSKAPLIRAKLVTLKNNKTVLLMDMHHIISDGETIRIIAKEISDLYNGKEVKTKEITYKDFAAWENKQKFKKAEKYWLSVYEDKVPILELPTNFSRPAVQSFEGTNIIKKLNKEIVEEINKTCKKLNITPYMLLMGVYYILLSEYAAANDVVVGTPVVGRNNTQLQNIIGMFVNTLPIRNQINQEESFEEFIYRVKENCLKAFENQAYPLDKLIKKLELQKDASRNTMFDVLFAYQHKSYPVMDFNKIKAKFYVPETNIAKFDIMLEATMEKESLNLRFEYCTKLFTKEFIEKMSKHYINILKFVLRNQKVKISDIDMIARGEKTQIINQLNNTQTVYERNKTVTELFEEQVGKTPDKTAVVFKNSKLTYRELNEKANALANYMKDKYKIKSQDKVAIFVKKSLESIISIIATLKLGAVFVPIDIEYPDERIEYILNDSKAKLVLTLKEFEKQIKIKIPKLNIEIDEELYKQNNVSNPVCDLKPEDLIYIMYTSGSTGKPKGVMVKHRNVVRLVRNTNYIDFSKCKRILQTGSIVFDACTFEIWGALLNGLSLYIIKKSELLDTKILEKYLVTNKIDTLWLTAPLFNQLSEENPYIFKPVKYLLTGGDVLSPKHINLVKDANPNITLINGYGPTENTTFSCCFTIDKKYETSIPIGKAISNSTAYIVSKNGKIQPKGVPGELWVGGDGVSKGYLNRKDLTAEKFIPNPFGKGKIYKTGDLVKLLDDGNIEFIGRIDNQVKIRGFRVELSEIDNVIHQYPGILKIYTLIKEINGNKILITYFTADRTLNIQDILLYLQERLPLYMIPQHLIQLETLPLTINGKVDKAKLPMPESDSKNIYVAPENEIQKQLCEIWQKLFNLKKVGIMDNFFELGGDSLLAIRLQTEALKQNISINYSDIFEHQTIKSLSEKKQRKELYKIDKNYDYTKINQIIEINNISNLEQGNEEKPIGNLLLFGATGFLGTHILDEYLSTTNGNVYCLVRRKNNEDSEQRLKNILNFYFDKKYNEEFGKRIFVVYGDITKEQFSLTPKEYKELGQKIDIVINSAALVKHFGDFEMFKSINVIGTKNIIEYCKKFDKKMYHISTMSVAGISQIDEDINNDEERILFSENKFYVGQNLNNAYVYTKFQAEKEILEQIPKGLKACILRMGNIFNRERDGKFQINVSENAYVNRIKALLNLGVVQQRFLIHALEFTPVDSAAKAILEIAKHNPKFNVLHVFNTQLINFPNLIAILNNLGYNIQLVTDEKFSERVKEFLKDENLKNKISGLIPDLNKKKTLSIVAKTLPDAYFTTLYLKSIGFEWPEIDKEYVEQFLDYFKKIGYIE